MSLEKKKIEELISTAKRITDAQKNNKEELLFEISKDNNREIDTWNSLLDDDLLQDPDQSYNLFYKGIQAFMLNLMPKSEIRTIILELKSIMMTGKEKKYISYGVRGADSRMSTTQKMESMIDTLTEWSKTPEDFFKLATLLLQKNKTLGFSPQDRLLGEYVPNSRKSKTIN